MYRGWLDNEQMISVTKFSEVLITFCPGLRELGRVQLQTRVTLNAAFLDSKSPYAKTVD